MALRINNTPSFRYLIVEDVADDQLGTDNVFPDSVKSQLTTHKKYGFYLQQINTSGELTDITQKEISRRIQEIKSGTQSYIVEERLQQIQGGFTHKNETFDFDADVYNRIRTASKATPYTAIDLFTKDGNVFSLDTKAKATAWLRAYEAARNKIEDDCIAERKKIT